MVIERMGRRAVALSVALAFAVLAATGITVMACVESATLAVSPASGVAGTAVTLSGSGLPATMTVTAAWLDGTPVGSATTDPSGALRGLAFTVPSREPVGFTAIVLRASSMPQHSVRVAFEVRGPAATPAPSPPTPGPATAPPAQAPPAASTAPAPGSARQATPPARAPAAGSSSRAAPPATGPASTSVASTPQSSSSLPAVPSGAGSVPVAIAAPTVAPAVAGASARLTVAPGRGGTSVLPRLLLEILAAGLGVAVGGLVIRRRRGPRT